MLSPENIALCKTVMLMNNSTIEKPQIMRTPETLPEVSVCMACYNAGAYLKEALDSLVRQTFTDWECVLVDDGSTDRSMEVAASLNDPRIRIIRHGKHDYTGALNLAWKMARARYIIKMDADDRSCPGRLHVLYHFMECHPEVAACGEGLRFFGDRTGVFRPSLLDHDEIVNGLARCNCMTLGIFRRSFMEAKGLCYDSRFPHAEDYKLWCDIARAGGVLNALPIVEYEYRIYTRQKTRQFREEMKRQAEEIRRGMECYINNQ